LISTIQREYGSIRPCRSVICRNNGHIYDPLKLSVNIGTKQLSRLRMGGVEELFDETDENNSEDKRTDEEVMVMKDHLK
jgi:hypothetical protein